MKYLWSVSVALCLTSACAFAQSFELEFTDLDLRAQATFEEPPRVMVEAFMTMDLMDGKTAAPYTAEKVEVILFMPEMDHGSKQTEVEEVFPGRYRVSDMYFLMGGLWEIRVKITSPDGISEQRVFSLEFDPATGACTTLKGVDIARKGVVIQDLLPIESRSPSCPHSKRCPSLKHFKVL